MSEGQDQEILTHYQDMILLLGDLKYIGYGIFSALFLLIGLVIVQLFFNGKGND